MASAFAPNMESQISEARRSEAAMKTEPEQIVADYMLWLWTSQKSTDRVIEAMADDLRALAGANRHVAEWLRRKAVGLRPTLKIVK